MPDIQLQSKRRITPYPFNWHPAVLAGTNDGAAEVIVVLVDGLTAAIES